jgi:hypothetical protein
VVYPQVREEAKLARQRAELAQQFESETAAKEQKEEDLKAELHRQMCALPHPCLQCCRLTG